MPLDLAADLDRIRAHIACLESAACDESALPVVRAGVAAELAVWRLAADLAGHDQIAACLDPREETSHA